MKKHQNFMNGHNLVACGIIYTSSIYEIIS